MSTSSPPSRRSSLPLRARLATTVGGAAGRASRLAGRGDGSVIGGDIRPRPPTRPPPPPPPGGPGGPVAATNRQTTPHPPPPPRPPTPAPHERVERHARG